MLPVILRTARLTLRPWSFDDLSALCAYASDEEWARFLPVPNPYSREDGQRFIAGQLLLDPTEHPAWAIEHEGVAVGGINVRLLERGRIAELGYSIARPLWGRGLVTEAGRAVVGAAFTGLESLARVRAMADARNLASRRVLEKIGLRQEGILRSNRYLREKPFDEVWYGVLRDEWSAR